MAGHTNRLVFFGNERLATGLSATDAPALRSLIASGCDIAAIVISQKPARSRAVRPLEVEALAAEHGIPLLSPSRPVDILNELAALRAPVAVLAAYGRIVPQSVIDVFPKGIINIHPSLLPRYRGPIPIEQAILDGAAATGVSIMALSAAMDAGPVFAQREVPLTGRESKAELAAKLGGIGAELLLEVLPAVLEGTASPKPQNNEEATYCSLLTPQSGLIDWQKPSVRLEREVRAYLGWPGSKTALFGRDVTVTAAAAAAGSALSPGQIRAAKKELAIGTGEGDLVIQRLKPSGKRDMSAAEFLAGLSAGRNHSL